jgi:hypothetical protein
MIMMSERRVDYIIYLCFNYGVTTRIRGQKINAYVLIVL